MKIDKDYMSTVEQWKDMELEGYKNGYIKYLEDCKDLKEEVEKAKEEYIQARERYYKEHGEYPVSKKTAYSVIFEDPEINQLYKTWDNADYKYKNYMFNENRFYQEYGYRSDFEDICRKKIDKHFEKLENKVKDKIGDIEYIRHLGGDDYLFLSSTGKSCKVEVILAGGYNIQRLHTRWVIKK